MVTTLVLWHGDYLGVTGFFGRSDLFPTLFCLEDLSDILFSGRWGFLDLNLDKNLQTPFLPSGILNDVEEGGCSDGEGFFGAGPLHVEGEGSDRSRRGEKSLGGKNCEAPAEGLKCQVWL